MNYHKLLADKKKAIALSTLFRVTIASTFQNKVLSKDVHVKFDATNSLGVADGLYAHVEITKLRDSTPPDDRALADSLTWAVKSVPNIRKYYTGNPRVTIEDQAAPKTSDYQEQ